MTDDKIRRRYVNINGEKVRFTYNLRNREVMIPEVGKFTATSWDSAPDEVREEIARKTP